MSIQNLQLLNKLLVLTIKAVEAFVLFFSGIELKIHFQNF